MTNEEKETRIRHGSIPKSESRCVFSMRLT